MSVLLDEVKKYGALQKHKRWVLIASIRIMCKAAAGLGWVHVLQHHRHSIRVWLRHELAHTTIMRELLYQNQ
jgi:hypothetical protein